MIRYLTLKNFKTFYGTVKVGPFDNLTAVIGANGAGKSCVFDAIAFCLAIKKSKYETESISSLKNLESGPEGECSVEICFESKEGDPIFLKRVLSKKNEDEKSQDNFYINTNEISKEDYRIFIKESKINSLVSTFWLNQGKFSN